MNYFCVFDFETDHSDPHLCNPVQVACMMIDPYNLEILDNSKFCSDMKPDNIDDPEYLTDGRSKTIEWHAKKDKCSKEDILAKWRDSPPTKIVWNNFVQHINKYNPKKSQWNAPYPCGMNINNFDMIILKTLNERYNISKLFNYETFDLRERLFTSLIWDTSLKSRSMDNIRKHFGMSSENAHDALQDVKDTAKIIQRFLKHDKNLFDRTRYKGCMESVEI
tara:strand:+ start:47 stop:709 length:663 start_codon:yes stop_codon:yes gene_type:complete